MNYTIIDIRVPIAVEVEIPMPEGKILGFSVHTERGNDILVLSVLAPIESPVKNKLFYIISAGTKMTSIDSIGKHYGTYKVNGRLLHIFKQNYKDRDSDVIPAPNRRNIHPIYWT
jgi:hypothetical protein